MKTLSAAAGFQSPKVEFCVYQLCKILGWSADGRSYRRIEDSMNRIARDNFAVQGRLVRPRRKSVQVEDISLGGLKSNSVRKNQLNDLGGRCGLPVTPFRISVWNQVIWKSFKDGFIRDIDMALFRRIARGRRREVPKSGCTGCWAKSSTNDRLSNTHWNISPWGFSAWGPITQNPSSDGWFPGLPHGWLNADSSKSFGSMR